MVINYIKSSILLSVIVLGLLEAYFRIPIIEQRLEYQADKELVAVLKPNQKGFQWLGNMSYKSEIIKINNDGNRGEETNWKEPVILISGNSEAMGCGVKDNEVWSYKLQEKLRIDKNKKIQVVNAAHPGFGPYHHYIRIKRMLDKHAKDIQNIKLIILRVDIADRVFRPVDKNNKKHEIFMAEKRQEIRKFTKSIPFLYNKAKVQINKAKEILTKLDRLIGMHNKVYIGPPVNDGYNMWKSESIWWLRIKEIAQEHNIPIVFLIVDAMNSKEMDFIEKKFREKIDGSRHAEVFRMKSTDFGIDEQTKEEIKKKYYNDFTLKRDPHANPKQHKLIADFVYKHIKDNTKLAQFP